MNLRRKLLPVVVPMLCLALSRQNPNGYAPPIHLGTLADGRITESSGIAASGKKPGVFWTHNDAGDGPYLYAFDSKGRALARFTVPGVLNHDWEDIASGPGGTLYIGDIGDNFHRRDNLAIYIIKEPAVDPKKTGQSGTAPPPAILPFRYPDGYHDAECLLVHPATGEIVIVTKEGSGANEVYTFPTPITPDRKVTLTKVVVVSFSGMTLPGRFERYESRTRMVTGGSVSADGKRVVVRTYIEACEWDVRRGQTIAAALTGAPRRFAMPLGQGESICYGRDGRSLYLTSEGSPCPLFVMRSASGEGITARRLLEGRRSPRP